ncbi:MAG: hypothetical protein JWN48_1058 [Myxococcaceae bacterium]|nr:hypothetical protein [Myxococcaceae bacterium]
MVKLALRMSAVVGTLLNVINQGDGIMAGHVDMWRLGLTYLVPYCVATYSATSVTLRAGRSSTAPQPVRAQAAE